MADEIPAALRQAEPNIYKCATKAVQLQSVKPIVAYWCEYWVVNQILAKQLHTASDEMLNYTTKLMDKLEATKTEYANEDAITDDQAGQAYIEQFAQETLDRAERVVKANKVTQQTAMTFDAAATFFHLVNIWGPADQETQQKIKYAKWNAARIVKALKEGKDPNESNPKQEDAPPQPALDPDDPEVQQFGGGEGTTPAPLPPNPRQVTVEDAPDGDVARDAAGVSLPHSPMSAAQSDELQLPGVPTDLQPPAQQPGYFDDHGQPSPISPPSHNPAAHQPPPKTWTPTPPPQAPHFVPPPSAPEDHYRSAPPPAAAPPPTCQAPTPAVAPAPVAPPAAHLPKPTMPPPSSSVSAAGPAGVVDEAAMAQAQKYAKWAISALNFEDVDTAIMELRRALHSLGAS
ncbi:Vta1 like-domain-containing protein [Coniochaeta sp. 2T2.1]|nr:Vta1 like-domain-containing protein [Coniochaeta sp. 2T2.1]